MLSAGSETKEQSPSDDYVHTSVQTEQTRQNEEQPPPEEDPDPRAELDITEPPENHSETAARTARYPSRTHHPPEYFRITY